MPHDEEFEQLRAKLLEQRPEQIAINGRLAQLVDPLKRSSSRTSELQTMLSQMNEARLRTQSAMKLLEEQQAKTAVSLQAFIEFMRQRARITERDQSEPSVPDDN